MIKREGDIYVLYTKDGSRALGRHPSMGAAMRQERAIKASEARQRGIKKGVRGPM